jgi:hypothetical protein
MMFSSSSWKRKLWTKGLLALTLGTSCWALPGCMNMAAMPGMAHETKTLPNGAPLGHAVDATTYWGRDLQMAPDPTHGGQRTPCLVGRLVLLGSDGKPTCMEGKVTVKLYDERPAQGGPPQMVEYWQIDNENLNKMVFKDHELKLWGYTLALPTACGPNITHARLDITFEPKHGNVLNVTSGGFRIDSAVIASYRDRMSPPIPITTPGQTQPGATQQAQYSPQQQQALALQQAMYVAPQALPANQPQRSAATQPGATRFDTRDIQYTGPIGQQPPVTPAFPNPQQPQNLPQLPQTTAQLPAYVPPAPQAVPQQDQVSPLLYVPNSVPPVNQQNQVSPLLYVPNSVPPVNQQNQVSPLLYVPNSVQPVNQPAPAAAPQSNTGAPQRMQLEQLFHQSPGQ